MDTICAVATPAGEGGIGVIRVSGTNAIPAVDAIFQGKKTLTSSASHSALFGRLIDSDSEKILDEVICLVMRSPRSFTGEDTVEISCHGNPRLLARVMQILFGLGVRQAERGEFTKRAFLNGKIDLTQAEGVLDAVSAVSEKGLELAANQLEGRLGKFLNEVRKEILEMVSPIEACIDFPEEEVPEVSRGEFINRIDRSLSKIESLIRGANHGRILREGFSAVIAGKPNVGKSSLLNLLLRESRAIVTEIPGTTRDTVEEWAEIGGLAMKLIDTAGIRDTRDQVEEIGIQRTREALKKSDFMLLVLDRSAGLDSPDLELLELAKKKKSLVLLNKMDLSGPLTVDQISKVYSGPVAPVSIKEKSGLIDVEKKIVDIIFDGNPPQDETIRVVRARHLEALIQAKQSLEHSRETLTQKLPFDLAVIDLRAAAESIGRISGESYTNDLLDKIFSDFCIGK